MQNKRGRKTKYDPDSMPGLAAAQAMDGHGTVEELAQYFNVAKSTISAWKNQFPEFLESIKRPNAIIDNMVENALLKRALGFEYEEVEIIANMAGKPHSVRKRKRHALPDVAACFGWLRNRKPEYWGGEKATEAGAAAGSNVDDLIAVMVKNNPELWADEELEIDLDPGIEIED